MPLKNARQIVQVVQGLFDWSHSIMTNEWSLKVVEFHLWSINPNRLLVRIVTLCCIICLLLQHCAVDRAAPLARRT